MLPLRELQSRFARSLFDGVDQPIASSVYDDGIDGAARLRIYRNNLHEGFTKTLSLEFPVIERLVGEDYFRQLARQFLKQHPSRAGNLHYVGEPLAGFLAVWFEGTEYAYMADVAALEWAYQESLVAVDAPPLDPGTLRGLEPEHIAELRLTLHPACRLVSSAWPIVRIWSVNQPDAPPDAVVDLASGADFVLVLRTAKGGEFRRLSAGEYALLHAFASSASLAEAFEAAHTADPSFDLGGALQRFIALGALTTAVLAVPPSPSSSGVSS